MISLRKGFDGSGDGVSFEEGVFNGAFGGDGEENFVMGDGVVVSSSSLDMFTKSCLGGMIVSLIFLEGLEEEAWVESMEVEKRKLISRDGKHGSIEPSHTKKVFANMKREGKGFSGRVTPLFQTMMVQAPEELDEGSEIPTDP
ncbi:hypothetical protein Tco_0343856 [Tanacetum coccineum]